MPEGVRRWRAVPRVWVGAAVVLTLLLAGRATAQAPAELVKDINPSVQVIGSNSSYITQVGAMTFFVATNPNTGSELWLTDGSAAGTVLVRDIVPGSGMAASDSGVRGKRFGRRT